MNIVEALKRTESDVTVNCRDTKRQMWFDATSKELVVTGRNGRPGRAMRVVEFYRGESEDEAVSALLGEDGEGEG